MIYICILLCTFIAPFTHAIGVQQSTEQKSQNLTHTSKEKAPDYEITSVEYELNESINQLSIKAEINGTVKVYYFQSVKGFLAGNDTKVWLAEKIGDKFNYVLQHNIMWQVNITFYHDEKTQSTISHTVNKRGISEFSGIIDSNRVIRPLRNHIRKRRDVSSESLHESDYDKNKNYHLIYKRSTTPINKGGNINSLVSNKSRQRRNTSHIENPEIVYPEILVYVDTTLLEYFEGDIVNTVAYTLILLNGVDLNFRQMENPEIRLNIAGFVLCKNQIIPSDTLVVTTDNLITFGEFMYKEDKFKLQQDYDIVILLGADPNFEQGLEGKAHKAGACSKNTLFEKIESTVLILDDTKFSGIDTVTHELSHLFGAPHDGSEAYSNLGGPGAEACSFDEGFIMSYERNDAKQFYFSQCSKEIMSFFFRQERAKCLLNNPAINRTDRQVLRILPGKYMTIDEQCQKRGYLKAYNVNPDVCVNMLCLKTETTYLPILEAALEGTPCDLGKYCLRGECVKVTLDDKNSDVKILLPPPFQLPGSNKSAGEQCKEAGVTNFDEAVFNDCEFRCITTNYQEETRTTQIGTAEDGTLCNNNNGYCRDGNCVKDSNA